MIKTIAFGIRLILFFTIPATIGLILLRFPIVNTLWERGEFNRFATEGTAIALLYYSVGFMCILRNQGYCPSILLLTRHQDSSKSWDLFNATKYHS